MHTKSSLQIIKCSQYKLYIQSMLEIAQYVIKSYKEIIPYCTEFIDY